jgi:hypothetical protein
MSSPSHSANVLTIRQSRLERMARVEARNAPAGAAPSDQPSAASTLAKAGFRQIAVHIVNRPARYPTGSLWPIELRADMVAALLDFRTTHELCKALAAGEAPRPTATRIAGSHAEPTWFRESVLAFVSRRHASGGKA